jgi:HAD superfamily hydrolase (TIGR01509 family)
MTSSWDRFFEAYCRGLCRDEEALSYAAQLKRRGIVVGVISNTNHVHTIWLREHLPEFAGFDSVIYSSDVGLMKPDSAIYALSLRQLGVAPQQALFVDDLPENVAGAQASGMDALLHKEWTATIVGIEAWLGPWGGKSGYHGE